MIRTPEHDRTQERLAEITSELEELNATTKEIIDLLQACVLRRDGQQPRLNVGVSGIVETVTL